MSFTDLTFLFGFFPVSWLLYQFIQKSRKGANLFLFVISMLFYAWGSLRQLAVLLLLCLFNYFACRAIDGTEQQAGRKGLLTASAGVNLLVLFFYRYLGTWFGFLDGIIHVRLSALPSLMPVGLSFYVFASLSALFDVYRKKAPACRSFISYALFTAFFARVNMGPIANYEQTLPQLDHHPCSAKKSAKGMSLFVQGLFAKVVIADNLGLLYQSLAGDTSWLGTLLFGFAYFFELYFDFMGYSRMARGIGSMFGFTIPENFNLPYTAQSVQDFWRRWHISLTSWFREYVYIPLGGNRVTHQRWMLNVAVVWLLTGLWHGATWPFLVWGLYQGALILAEHQGLNRMLEKCPALIRHLYVIIAQLIGWTFFSSAGLGTALLQIARYFGLGVSTFASGQAMFSAGSAFVLLVLAVWISSGLSRTAARMLSSHTGSSWWLLQVAGYTVMFAICIVFLVAATSQTFLYAVF